jgi:hypothetical protein
VGRGRGWREGEVEEGRSGLPSNTQTPCPKEENFGAFTTSSPPSVPVRGDRKKELEHCHDSPATNNSERDEEVSKHSAVMQRWQLRYMQVYASLQAGRTKHRVRTHDRRCAKTSDTRRHASNNPVHATHPGLCL